MATNFIQWIEKSFDKIQLGNIVFTIISTPGHSLGSISLYCETKKVIFCGDVLFINGHGRTDFDGGNSSDLAKSIDYILSLDEDTLVLPGHCQPFRIKNKLPCNLATK